MEGFARGRCNEYGSGWISTSCKLGVEGGGLHCGHCDEIKEGDDEEINARGASCTDSIVEIYRCR